MKRLSILMATAALAAGCATAPPQAPPPVASSAAAAQPVASDVLASAVYSRLNTDRIYYFRHVEVAVDPQGIAHLSGYVWSPDALYAARRIAQSVPGVTGVVTSQLELERNGRGNGATR